jgi:hypothetical protein
MKKFHALDVQKLTNSNLAGLGYEVLIAGRSARSALGPLGVKSFDLFEETDSIFRERVITIEGSPITPQIHEGDKVRRDSISEIMRISNAMSKSSIEPNATAAKTLVTFLHPYRNVQKEPIMTETSTINHMQNKYFGDIEVQNAAATLQLVPLFNRLFEANERVATLWNKRAAEDAAKSGPSPSSLRSDLEKSYHNFCEVIVQTLDLTPSPEVENLFFVMNEIRIKYAQSLPVKLTEANTSVAIVPVQKYTGKAITPIPTVFFKTDDETLIELRFTVDFYVTYRNNIKVGEAKLIIHGKGKYTGRYSSTFHVEN